MSDVLLISKAKPDQKSLDFTFLREKGLESIQSLASKIWTDFNTHDPGITVLEQLIYAITELGYRTNFDIKDILAQNPNNNHLVNSGIYTSPQIFTNAPVTQDDYKKILLDIEGIRNAFVNVAQGPEIPVYINPQTGEADYTGNELIDITGLYSVILELDTDDQFGDLNSGILNWSFVDSQSEAGEMDAEVSFPSWLKAPVLLRKAVSGIASSDYPRISSIGLEPDSLYPMEERRTFAATIKVVIAIDGSTNDDVYLPVIIVIQEDIAKMNSSLLQTDLTGALNNNSTSSIEQLILNYNKKLVKIWGIVNTAQNRLSSYRNLCEDFIELKNIEIEEVGLCLQIEVGPGADINAIEAEIYHRIGTFLSPRIKFHSAAELLERGMTVDEVFEGPLLQHGFLDLSEFLTIDERKILYVSDLIQIIMAIPGVVSVGDIHLNSYIDNLLMNESVKDCLAPTFAESHRLRLSIQKSSTIYFRDDDPTDSDKVLMIANRKKVADKIKELQILDNNLLLGNQLSEFNEPEGTYRNLQEYYSVQNNFPLAYGVGPAGIDSDNSLRLAQVKQLKSYLLFSEQLMANLLSQLSHIKELFAIDKSLKKTYFTQLIDIPNPFGTDYAPYVNPAEFTDTLQNIIEDKEVYIDRRNRVLDHLLARFSEDFSIYSLKMFETFGAGTEERVIEDKLNFLNNLPAVSGDRFRSFNYKDGEKVWNTDNVPGYQKRVSLQLGISDFRRKSLYFEFDERTDDVSKIFRLYENVGGHGPINPANAYILNPENEAWSGFAGVYAENDAIEATSKLLDENELSEYLFINTFDLSFIPSDAIIEGIKVEVIKRIDSASGISIGGDIEDYEIRLLKDGIVVGENKARVNEPWLKESKFFSYGGITDLWDEEWTYADITNSDFGVAIRVKKTGEKKRQANIDNVKLTVFYSSTSSNPTVKYHFVSQPPYVSYAVSGISEGYASEQERKDAITDLAVYGYNYCNYCIDTVESTFKIKKAHNAEEREDMCNLPLKIISFNSGDRIVTVEGNYHSEILVNSGISIQDIAGDWFPNIVDTVVFDGDNNRTEITLNEELTAGQDPDYFKYIMIEGVNVVYTGSASDIKQAAVDLCDLIFNTFWTLEGMHVIEHILLRPKVNEKHFVEFPANSIRTLDIGTIKYFKYIGKDDFTVDYNFSVVSVETDITSQVSVGSAFSLIDESGNVNTYTVQTIEYDEDTLRTKIKSYEYIGNDQPLKYLSYERKFAVSSFDEDTNSVGIGKPELGAEIYDIMNTYEGLFIFEVFNSQYNAGIYKITDPNNVNVSETETILTIEEKQKLFSDDLLPVSLSDDDCVCPELKDNYSFRISVIMPEWPTRFKNSAFRKLAERTIRMEAPAHVHVRLVWAQKEQMKTFEPAYKDWLTQIAIPEPDGRVLEDLEEYKKELNSRHDTLVQELFALRNQKGGAVIGDIAENSDTTTELSLIGQIYLG